MLTPSVRSTTEVDLNRPMQEGWLSRRSIMKTWNAPPACSLEGGMFLVNVSFLVLLRGGDDALGTLAAAFSLLALFLCYFVYI
jgi:hypothetical protein